MGLHRRVWDGAASSLREAEEAEDALRAEDRAVPWAPPDVAGVWLPNKMGQQASCLQGLNSCSSSFVQCHHPHGLSRSPRFALAYVVSHVGYFAIIVGGVSSRPQVVVMVFAFRAHLVAPVVSAPVYVHWGIGNIHVYSLQWDDPLSGIS